MNNLSGTAAKLAPKPFTLTVKARNLLLGVAGFSAVMIAKSELNKQSVKQTIDLKKKRLAMVSHLLFFEWNSIL